MHPTRLRFTLPQPPTVKTRVAWMPAASRGLRTVGHPEESGLRELAPREPSQTA